MAQTFVQRDAGEREPLFGAASAQAWGRQASVPLLADFRNNHTSSLISPIVVVGLLRLAEFVLLCVLGLVIGALYLVPATTVLTAHYLFAICGVSAGTILMFQLLDLYSLQALMQSVRKSPRVMLGWTIVCAALVAGVFFFKAGDAFSRVWMSIWFVSGAAGLLVVRLAASRFARNWARQGRLNRRAIIYGCDGHAEGLIAALEAEPDSDIRICGLFDDRADSRAASSIAGYPLLGNVNELMEFARKTRIDMLIVSLPLAAETRMQMLLRRLWVLPIDIRLAVQNAGLRFRPQAYSYVGNVPFLDLADKPIANWDFVSKWLFDKLVGAAALVALAPIMALVALAVKLDSRGPVLFRQKRYGFNNELIEVFKFRSMYTEMTDANAGKLVTKDDPRVTRVGRFIRKTSLDELPQLFNVMRGELSLVGPRPHALQAKAADCLYDDVVDGYFARHKVKPGITGWAQINGWRGETDTHEKIEKRVEHDLYYIENWSVFLDIYILLKTPVSLLKSENAY